MIFSKITVAIAASLLSATNVFAEEVMPCLQGYDDWMMECGDLIKRSTTYSADHYGNASPDYSIKFWPAPGTKIYHFDNCMTNFDSQMKFYSFTSEPNGAPIVTAVPPMDIVSTVACGAEGLGQRMSVSLTGMLEGDGYMVVTEAKDNHNPMYSDRGFFEVKYTCPEDQSGLLDPSFICADPQFFTPNMINPSDPRYTCETAVNDVMGSLRHILGPTFEANECNATLDSASVFTVASYIHQMNGHLFDCCGGHGTTQICPNPYLPPQDDDGNQDDDFLVIADDDGDDGIPPPAASTGNNGAGGNTDPVVAIVAGSALTVIAVAAIIGTVFVKTRSPTRSAKVDIDAATLMKPVTRLQSHPFSVPQEVAC